MRCHWSGGGGGSIKDVVTIDGSSGWWSGGGGGGIKDVVTIGWQ